MAHLQHFNPSFSFDPPPPPNTKISMSASSYNMCIKGVNVPVRVTASGIEDMENKADLPSVDVLAHFGGGAFTTCIDEKLAKSLALTPVGMTRVKTVGGYVDMPKYIVTLTFPNTGLKGNLLYVVACDLGYKGDKGNLEPTNFSVLLGRDVAANWNMVLNGPTSTAFISD